MEIYFCLLENLPTYSDPDLSMLTHPCNVQLQCLIIPYCLRPFSSLLCFYSHFCFSSWSFTTWLTRTYLLLTKGSLSSCFMPVSILYKKINFWRHCELVGSGQIESSLTIFLVLSGSCRKFGGSNLVVSQKLDPWTSLICSLFVILIILFLIFNLVGWTIHISWSKCCLSVRVCVSLCVSGCQPGWHKL